MGLTYSEYMRRCIEECKTCGNMNTASGAELLIDMFARYLDANLPNVDELMYKFCPEFELTGEVVTCHPVEGYPLEVVSHISPVQEGDGEPSPENIRMIGGHEQVVLNCDKPTNGILPNPNLLTLDVPFGRTVYGGTYDWNSGILTENLAGLALNGTESWSRYTIDDDSLCYYYMIVGEYDSVVAGNVISSHFPTKPVSSQVAGQGVHLANSSAGEARLIIRPDMSVYPTVELWKEYLAEQYAAGTPVTVVYEMTEPTEVRVPEEYSMEAYKIESYLKVLSSISASMLSSSTGDTTVKGRSDPAWLIASLEKRIVELEADGAGGGAIQRIESTDTENMVVLRDLESGSYVLYGRFVPYAGADSTMMFSSGLLANVIKRTADTQIQIFYPVNNCVQHLTITDTEYTRKDVHLNDLTASA